MQITTLDQQITPEELEASLRMFGGPMQSVTVRPKHNTLIGVSHIVVIAGACTVHGKPFGFETEFNLREIARTADVLRLAGMILQAFQKAEAGIPL